MRWACIIVAASLIAATGAAADGLASKRGKGIVDAPDPGGAQCKRGECCGVFGGSGWRHLRSGKCVSRLPQIVRSTCGEPPETECRCEHSRCHPKRR